MTLNKSYVITDSQDKELFRKGPMLMDEGYTIKAFSISKSEYSHYYNPLKYVFDKDGNFSEEKVSVIGDTYISECLGKDNPYKDAVKRTFLEGIRTLVTSDTKHKDLMGLLDIFKRWSETMEPVSIVSGVDTVLQYPLKMLITDLIDLLFKYDGKDILTDAEENTVLHLLDVDIENFSFIKTALFIDMSDIDIPVIRWINSLLMNQCRILISEARKTVKDKYCITHKGEVMGMFDTKREASQYKDMFENAYVRDDFGDGKVCLMSENGRVIAYLISRSEGKKLISEFKKAEVTRYKKKELPF